MKIQPWCKTQKDGDLQSMSEESASPRADGRAAGGHTCTPEEEGPTPPAFALVEEVGSMGDDAGPEQLDWGSIDDEDGAFGQLSEASNIQDSVPLLSGGLLSGERQVPAADEPIGGAGGAVAITPGASAVMHSSGELEEREMRGEPAAGCSAQQGIRQGADLVFPGAPKSSMRQVFIARSSIVHQVAVGLGGIRGAPNLALSMAPLRSLQTRRIRPRGNLLRRAPTGLCRMAPPPTPQCGRRTEGRSRGAWRILRSTLPTHRCSAATAGASTPRLIQWRRRARAITAGLR